MDVAHFIESLNVETAGLILGSALLFTILFMLQLRNSRWLERLAKLEAQSSRDARLERLLKLVEQGSGKSLQGKTNRPVSKAKKVPSTRSVKVDKSRITAGRRRHG